jgi:hypothetical protein
MTLGQNYVAVPTDDPGLVMDANQIRQSLYDPSMISVADQVIDPNTGQPIPQINVVAKASPSVWPLVIALGIVGYALFQGGKHS